MRSARGRQRVKRWRDEHNGVMGIYPMRDDVPQEEMRSKAEATWQWFNHLHGQVAPGKVVLRINFDETAVCVAQNHKKGNLLLRKRAARRGFGTKVTRAYLNHVAFICDDAEIQRLLPQVIIGNEYVLKAGELAALRARVPHNTVFIRAHAAWVNGPACKTLLKLLHDALAPFLERVQPILLFDAYKGHLTYYKWNSCAKFRIWPILVPASMTWYFQPLDTHSFAAYKRRLHDAYQELCAELRGGVGGVSEVVDSIVTATAEVLNVRSWAHAFDRNGYSAGQTGVPKKAWELLGVQRALVIGSARPSDSHIRACCPKNFIVRADSALKAVGTAATPATARSTAVARPTAPVADVEAGPQSSLAGSSDDLPIAARTRSRGRLK